LTSHLLVDSADPRGQQRYNEINNQTVIVLANRNHLAVIVNDARRMEMMKR